MFAPRFQNKVLRTIVNAPWYIPNKLLHTDLQMPTVREEITKFSTNHRAKLLTHPNELTSSLLNEQGPGRLKRSKPLDLLNYVREPSRGLDTLTDRFAEQIRNVTD